MVPANPERERGGGAYPLAHARGSPNSLRFLFTIQIPKPPSPRNRLEAGEFLWDRPALPAVPVSVGVSGCATRGIALRTIGRGLR